MSITTIVILHFLITYADHNYSENLSSFDMGASNYQDFVSLSKMALLVIDCKGPGVVYINDHQNKIICSTCGSHTSCYHIKKIQNHNLDDSPVLELYRNISSTNTIQENRKIVKSSCRLVL